MRRLTPRTSDPIAGQVVIVTGGGGGIGGAICAAFGRAGALVAVADLAARVERHAEKAAACDAAIRRIRSVVTARRPKHAALFSASAHSASHSPAAPPADTRVHPRSFTASEAKRPEITPAAPPTHQWRAH